MSSRATVYVILGDEMKHPEQHPCEDREKKLVFLSIKTLSPKSRDLLKI